VRGGTPPPSLESNPVRESDCTWRAHARFSGLGCDESSDRSPWANGLMAAKQSICLEGPLATCWLLLGAKWMTWRAPRRVGQAVLRISPAVFGRGRRDRTALRQRPPAVRAASPRSSGVRRLPRVRDVLTFAAVATFRRRPRRTARRRR